jgi:hypothetical protein
LRQKAAKIISNRFADYPIWGFKYGRTLRILPLWEPLLKELDIEPAFIIALRGRRS